MISELKTSVAAGHRSPRGRTAQGRLGVVLGLSTLLAGLAGCGQKGALFLPATANAAPAASAAVAK